MCENTTSGLASTNKVGQDHSLEEPPTVPYMMKKRLFEQREKLRNEVISHNGRDYYKFGIYTMAI